MEYFWYMIAALAAGMGTGFAGLSAATIIVPILIFLCPSFAGEMGVYQATAIALASDILGSAVTTGVYIKHKNIDLKRGWIMLICIVSMCIAGSYIAYLAGNKVLGSFSLFLTFCIGIRFLIKPDNEYKNTTKKGSKLALKDIAISLFFGLTIGFGTGFVGTGGGMMMLIVFTFFLGMNLKTAVGTSTFIMTFTALIASISHILIEPAIILERWNTLLICIIITTISSLLSAQFANHVKNRTIGLITGTLLLFLSTTMIFLHYWEEIKSIPILYGVLICCGEFCEYIGFSAIILMITRLFFKIPPYIFRKLLHLIAFSSLIEMIIIADTWYTASLTALLFAAIVYPIFRLCEKYFWYDNLFVQKKKGEVKISLILLFTMISAVIAFSWGLLDHKYIAITAILMWGIGDAAAAIIGIRFGKHIIPWNISDGKKTFEGSFAMLCTSFLSGFLCMLILSELSWYLSFTITLLSALVATFVELISKKGLDTVTVPIAVTIILALSTLF